MMLALLLGGADEAPTDAITSYCGGGVTGGGGGLRIAPDGAVVRLRRPHAGAPLEETRLEDRAEAYARIAALLDTARFERMPRGEPSNMTCSLARRRGGQSHLVMWGIGRAPAALQPALREMEALGR